MTGFCSWSEVYLVLINIEKKALYWQNSHFWPLLRRGAKLAVLSSGSKRWDPIRSINYGNVWKYTLNPNLKDCRKQEKKKATGRKDWPFHCFQESCFENWILFLQPPLAIPWGTETSFQWLHKYCTSGQIALYLSLSLVIPSVYPLLHCTYWMSALACWTRLLKMQLNTNPQTGLNCHDLSPACPVKAGIIPSQRMCW